MLYRYILGLGRYSSSGIEIGIVKEKMLSEYLYLHAVAGGQNPAALDQNPSTRVSEGQGTAFGSDLQGHLPG